MTWIPLHVHSQYSILNSSASVSALAAKAKDYGMPALALTDMGNLYGAVEFFKACKSTGIKPILGCELHVAPQSRLHKKRTHGYPNGFPIILIAKNKKGYQNLCRLSSIAHLEGFYYTPRIDKEILFELREGLICLSGPLQGGISYLILQDKEEELLKEIQWYEKAFKEDFYFELQRHAMTEEHLRADGMHKEPWLYQSYFDYINNQQKIVSRLVSLSKEMGIPCVATNESHYISREDWRAHEILMNIQTGEPVEIWEKDSFGNPKTRMLNPKRLAMPLTNTILNPLKPMKQIICRYS